MTCGSAFKNKGVQAVLDKRHRADALAHRSEGDQGSLLEDEETEGA